MLANQTLPTPEDQIDAASNLAQGQPAVAGDAMVVESRFGTLEVRPEHILTLPKGLLGFGEFQAFGLAALPDGQHPQFQVLQCLEAPDLAFLVAPLNIQSDAIDESDLRDACENLGIDRESLAVFLIVTVRRNADGAEVSMNMRAPLFVDVAKQAARQYVLPNNKYSIRHTL
jgi:flagellar assembly factor FliW